MGRSRESQLQWASTLADRARAGTDLTLHQQYQCAERSSTACPRCGECCSPTDLQNHWIMGLSILWDSPLTATPWTSLNLNSWTSNSRGMAWCFTICRSSYSWQSKMEATNESWTNPWTHLVLLVPTDWPQQLPLHQGPGSDGRPCAGRVCERLNPWPQRLCW